MLSTAGSSTATLALDGQALEQHQGGYLPFQREITAIIKENNTLTVQVDSRFVSIPPAGNPKGPHSVDYLLPGGITGSVHLRVLPQVFVSDVFWGVWQRFGTKWAIWCCAP